MLDFADFEQFLCKISCKFQHGVVKFRMRDERRRLRGEHGAEFGRYNVFDVREFRGLQAKIVEFAVGLEPEKLIERIVDEIRCRTNRGT